MAYTRVNWEDSPSTNTPRNATNLNKMDKGIYDNDRMLQYGIKGSTQFYSTIDDFKSALITSAYAIGSYIVDLNINGTLKNAIVQKASNSYLSFVLFGYSERIHEYKYNNGSWNDFQYFRENTKDIFISTNSIDTLVSTLISNMTRDGIYNFVGGWSGHSNGYTAICQCAHYDSSNDAYSGIVLENANGQIYTFTKRTTQNAVIKDLSSKNYYSDTTKATSLIEDAGNHQALTKTGNIVTLNVAFFTKTAFTAGTYYDLLLAIPQAIRPPANQAGSAYYSAGNTDGLWYYQTSSGNIRVKFSTNVPSGSEICLFGTYSLI